METTSSLIIQVEFLVYEISGSAKLRKQEKRYIFEV
jgi:hypothetical protein